MSSWNPWKQGRRLSLLGTLAAVGSLVASMGIALAAPGVTPSSVSQNANPGTTIGPITKTVETAPIPPRPDIFFLADTTGSMGPAIANVRTNATNIMNTVAGVQPDAQFGAGEYKDVGDPFVYRLNQAITASIPAAQAGINAWVAAGGGDTPECQLFALQQVATQAATGFRAGSSRIVVWFGDASGHDPCNGVSLAQAIAALQAANITVIAINVLSGGADGLNATGQATAITNATGGQFFAAVNEDAIADAILEGLTNLPVTVTHTVGPCDPNLTVNINPASQTGTSGDTFLFTETIQVAAGAPQGTTLSCTVQFLINGEPAGPAFTETITIRVNDVTPPAVRCVETTNPNGNTVPPAGSTTLPGPKGGQNEDGFYELLARDNVDPNPQIFVVDTGSGTVFGPYSNGTKIKYTEAPGATPNEKKIGSTTGNAGAVSAHITGTGDAAVYAVDASGNTSDRVACLVPPPPK